MLLLQSTLLLPLMVFCDMILCGLHDCVKCCPHGIVLCTAACIVSRVEWVLEGSSRAGRASSLMQRALGPGRRDSAMDSALHLYRKLYNLLYTNLMYNPCTPALTADIQPIQLTLIVTGGLHTMQPIQYTARIHYAGYTVYSTIHHPSGILRVNRHFRDPLRH